MSKNIILGAGIAGLGAAHGAKRHGQSTVIFESRERAGGLLDNFSIDGFRFDTAVHLSFATEPEVREIFDKTPYWTHNPESFCWDAGFWLKHPVQNNMYPLPSDEKVALIAGLIDAPDGAIYNYRDWLVQQYGEPIAARWPLTYTEKYWTIPAEQMGTAWIGQRMRRADIREVLNGAFTSETPNLYYVKEMRYPKSGGYRAFLDPLIADTQILYNCEAVEIDAVKRFIRFKDGRVAQYDALVSTLPLPDLVKIIRDVPEDIQADAATLFATTIDLISVGFNKARVSPSLWFYIYDRDILAARAYSPDWKSPDNVPEGCSSLQFEIYSSRKNPLAASVEDMKANTIAALQKMELATQADIKFVHHKKLIYGNVVFDLGMEERRDNVLRWVRSQGLQVAGRFGEWDYLWSNQSLMSGIKAGEAAFGS